MAIPYQALNGQALLVTALKKLPFQTLQGLGQVKSWQASILQKHCQTNKHNSWFLELTSPLQPPAKKQWHGRERGHFVFCFQKNWWRHLWTVPVQPKFRCHPKLRQIVCTFWLLGSIVQISQSFPTTFSLLSQLPWKWWIPNKNIIYICLIGMHT